MSENLLEEEEFQQTNYFLKKPINNEDLANACRRLQLTGPLEPLLRDLKHQEHENRASAKEKDTTSKKHNHKTERKTSKNAKNTYGQESWGRDSGARDLSPELQRVPTSSGTDSQMTENETGTCSMLDLASKLQVAALSALKTEVLELSARLQQTENERESLQKQLNEAIEEKERSHRRLESVGAAHESRITEMHCVIVELSKKIKARQDSAILEEHEPDGSVSELSFQEGSVYNSDIEGCGYEPESQTEPLDTKLEQPDRKSADNSCSFPLPTINTTQIEVMQEEILHLRAQVALLQSQLASEKNQYDRNVDVDEIKENSDSIENDDEDPEENEKEIFYYDKKIINNSIDANNDTLDLSEFVQHSTAKFSRTNEMVLPPARGVSPVVQLLGSIGSIQKQSNMQTKTTSNELPIAKMAERVRLRRTSEEQYITGPDIMNTGICTTEIAEHLVSDLLQPEIAGNSNETPHLQNEIQRLQRRIEHLKVQNSVLSLTLSENKAHCDHLYLLCGKYESNAVALQQALNYSDRAIEAYDVMLALFESRLDILQNNPSAEKNREDAEIVAKHLLDHLESENNMQGNSLGPWQDTLLIYSNKITDKNIPWSKEDDYRLRSHISKLKGHRAAVQNTIVTLESPYYNEWEEEKKLSSLTKKIDSGTQQENRRMDLETAVLMQELMSMREDISEFKFRAEQAEREKRNAEERLLVLKEAIIHLQGQLSDSETLLAMANKDRSSYSEAEHAVGIERELVEALARESRLKARLQGLASSVEAAARSSEEKYSQLQNTVSELNKANITLNHSLERCKRKYQTRLRRLEQQLQEITTKKIIGLPRSPSRSLPLDHQYQHANVPETTL